MNTPKLFPILQRRLLSISNVSRNFVREEFYKDNSIVRLVLSDPKRHNALSREMISVLRSKLAPNSARPEHRVVILAADGKIFSSGHDLRQMTGLASSDDNKKLFTEMAALVQDIQRYELPVIAEVSGFAVAAGCQLVASCDVVVAGESARFSTPGQKVGLFCSTPGVALARAVPEKVAAYMLFTADTIDANDAYRAGLISRIVPDADVQDQTLKTAEKICEHSRYVTTFGKQKFYAQLKLPLPAAYDLASEAMVENLKQHDAQEGIEAFINKRSPNFKHVDEKVK